AAGVSRSTGSSGSFSGRSSSRSSSPSSRSTTRSIGRRTRPCPGRASDASGQPRASPTTYHALRRGRPARLPCLRDVCPGLRSGHPQENAELGGLGALAENDDVEDGKHEQRERGRRGRGHHATTRRTHGTMPSCILALTPGRSRRSTCYREEGRPTMKVGIVAAVVGVLIVGTGRAKLSTCQQQAKSDCLACKNQCKSDFIDARFACKNINPQCGMV